MEVESVVRRFARRSARRVRKGAVSYGKKFWTNKGKYGRYVYRFGRRVAFEEVGRYAQRKARSYRKRK